MDDAALAAQLDDTLAFRARGRGRAVALGAGIPLLLVAIALIIFTNPLGGIVLALIALCALSTLWQRATLTGTELIVRGRLGPITQQRVDLAALTAVHQDRSRTTWVAAEGQRPFRIYFASGSSTFVQDARLRAAARGAHLDVTAPLIATPPADARPVFTL